MTINTLEELKTALSDVPSTLEELKAALELSKSSEILREIYYDKDDEYDYDDDDYDDDDYDDDDYDVNNHDEEYEQDSSENNNPATATDGVFNTNHVLTKESLINLLETALAYLKSPNVRI